MTVQPTETAAPQIEPSPVEAPRRRSLWWLDLLLMLVLIGTAFVPRWEYGRGDLWLDESDYVIASTFGFGVNRSDNELAPGLPEKLVVLRHYHAPMTAYLLSLGRMWGDKDQQIRMPFMVVGGLVCCATYLCGLRMFKRRDVALFCGLVVAVTPMQVRAGSHALPWAMITLTLLGLIYTLQSYVATRHVAWIIALFGVMGVQFASSEILFPSLVALAVAAPVALWPHIKESEERSRLVIGIGFGLLLFFLIAIILWPAGLSKGNAFHNLMHYADLAARFQNSARLGGVTYTPAPKWAYLYWYFHDFRPYFVLYALGIAATLLLLMLGKLPREAGVLWCLGGTIAAVAHRANMFGPEYFAHCLPFFTLGGGLALAPLARWRGKIGPTFAWPIMLAAFLVMARFQKHWQNDAFLLAQRRSRWPEAAKFLAPRLNPDDEMAIAPQDPSVPRWYLFREIGWPVMETRIAPFPLQSVSQEYVQSFAAGKYRFVILSSTFGPPPYFPSALKPEVARTWKRVYNSGPEIKDGPPRMYIYERVKPKAPTMQNNQAMKPTNPKRVLPPRTPGGRP